MSDVKIRPGQTVTLDSGKKVKNEGSQDVFVRKRDLAAYTKDGKNGKIRVWKGESKG